MNAVVRSFGTVVERNSPARPQRNTEGRLGKLAPGAWVPEISAKNIIKNNNNIIINIIIIVIIAIIIIVIT
jgi:hypothetical protein